MKPAEKVLRSWIRSLPTGARNVNVFNTDGVLTRVTSAATIRLYGSVSPTNVIYVCRMIRQDYKEISGDLRRLQ